MHYEKAGFVYARLPSGTGKKVGVLTMDKIAAVLTHKLQYVPPADTKMPSTSGALKALLEAELGKECVLAPHRAALLARGATASE